MWAVERVETQGSIVGLDEADRARVDEIVAGRAIPDIMRLPQRPEPIPRRLTSPRSASNDARSACRRPPRSSAARRARCEGEQPGAGDQDVNRRAQPPATEFTRARAFPSRRRDQRRVDDVDSVRRLKWRRIEEREVRRARQRERRACVERVDSEHVQREGIAVQS